MCDWWSVGVILFEMLQGRPPFQAETPELTQLRIIEWQSTLEISPKRPKADGRGFQLMPETASNLIRKLLCDQENRLGAKRGAEEIKPHKFFSLTEEGFRKPAIRWDNLRAETNVPYKPTICSETDTSNFDEIPANLRSTDGGSFGELEEFGAGDHAFFEFTFRRFFDADGYGCPTLRSSTSSESASGFGLGSGSALGSGLASLAQAPAYNISSTGNGTGSIGSRRQISTGSTSSPGMREFVANSGGAGRGNVLRITTGTEDERRNNNSMNNNLEEIEDDVNETTNSDSAVVV